MSSQWIRPVGCNRAGGVLGTFLKAGCFAVLSILLLTANAQWQDPLVTPSFKTQRAHESLLLDVARADTRLVAVGNYGNIIYSDDNGISWIQADVPVSITLTSVYFVSGNIGWAAGHDGIILKTTNGGQSWQKQFDGYRANQEIVDSVTRSYKKAEEALAAAEQSGNGSAIANAEEALEALEFKLEDASYDLETGSTKPFLDLWFYDANQGFAVGAYGMLFQTQDGGKHWQNISGRLYNPENFHLNGISFVGGNALVVTGEHGLIMRSDDFGQNWHGLDSPYDGSLFGLAAQGDNQLLYGLRGHVFHTVDGGLNWSELKADSKQTLIGSYVGKNKTFLVGNGGVVVEFDAAMTKPVLHIIEGSKAYSGVVQAVDGTLVLVGEAGVMRLNSQAQLINQAISMAAVGGN